ncbi:MAG: hypothetical protein AAFR67_03180 [Chloroflexota bacterium]
MTDVSLHQFLVLLTWFLLAALLCLTLLIARFYQKFSGEQMHYRLYFVCIVLFGAMFVRIAGVGFVVGDYFADALSIVGGSLLLFLSLILYFRMMRSKDNLAPPDNVS